LGGGATIQLEGEGVAAWIFGGGLVYRFVELLGELLLF
jgi:hypothetical protein